MGANELQCMTQHILCLRTVCTHDVMRCGGVLLQVTWRGPNIVVFNDVVIKPPYKLEDVNGSPESRELTYVKKLVEKFINDQSSTSAEVAA